MFKSSGIYMQFISECPYNTKKTAQDLASKARGGEVYCLYGELGSGKTTFMNGFINFFLPNKRVLSPTFIIARHYTINNNFIKKILHVDLYRLTNISSIKNLGLEEFFYNPEYLVAIEWAGRMGYILPKKRIEVKFNIKGDNKRLIEINNK